MHTGTPSANGLIVFLKSLAAHYSAKRKDVSQFTSLLTLIDKKKILLLLKFEQVKGYFQYKI